MVQFFQTLDPNVQSAIIAVFSTLLFILIKDIIIHNIRLNIEKKANSLKIYKKYSKPLLISIERLLWRLREIISNSSFILMHHDFKNEYHRYKYLSTMYRFYSVLGWLTLARRELTFLKVSRKKKMREIDNAISQFKSSLADGQPHKIHRFNNIIKYLRDENLELNKETTILLCNKIEQLLYEVCNKDKDQINDKDELVEKIKNIFSEYLLELEINDGNDFIDNIFFIEGLIYRDWQDAIGEMMLVSSKDNEYEYEVMNYKSFEEMYIKYENGEENIWIKRGERFFKNLSISNNREIDKRVNMILNITQSLIDLLATLTDINIGGSVVKKHTIAKFRRFKKELDS